MNEAGEKGRRRFAAQIAASVAALFIVRLADGQAEGETNHQSIETLGRANGPQLPPPKGSVKRRG